VSRDASVGRALRWSVVASVVALALVVSGSVPLVGFALAFVALDAAAWWFGADSRDPDERSTARMPE
jgi:hypothetical protein